MKKWYAVQTGVENEWGWGAYNFKEARKMATAEHRRNPGKEVRILVIDEANNYCDEEIVIYEADGAI